MNTNANAPKPRQIRLFLNTPVIVVKINTTNEPLVPINPSAG